MQFLNTIFGIPLGYIMYLCYRISMSYGLSIILFTLASKLILLPVSILVQKNSIKMVKLQPELNSIKERYSGDRDRIAEEQIKIYEREHYSPALGCLPLLLQIPLVLGLISVIYNPLQHLLHIDAATISALVARASEVLGRADLGSSPQLEVLRLINDPATAASFSSFPAELLATMRSLRLDFLGLNLSETPVLTSITVLVPVLAGLSAWLLCVAQDRANVLQREQSRLSQILMTLFMIAFSTYFAFIVPSGVGVYWIFGNLFAILLLFALNLMYDPKKYIDYENRPKKLTTEELAAKKAEKKALGERERADIKRFDSLDNWPKELVVYSERSGFYKYISDILSWLLDNTDIVIHYVTSDPNDQIFGIAEKRGDKRIEPYYVGNEKLAGFFLRIDADIMLTTLQDLGQFHLKRSMARKDMEYILCFNYPLSTHMVSRRRAFSDYDTIFMVGEFQREELRQAEHLDGSPQKKLVLCGYGLFEQLKRRYDSMDIKPRERKKVLIAPSWQPDNILDSCIQPMLESLLGKGYDVVVRPHPEYVKRYMPRLQKLLDAYKDYDGGDLSFELDFAKDDSLYDSDVAISDWSGAAYEFAFVTKKPVLFVDTPPKVMNEDYKLLTVEPLELSLRDKVGLRVKPEEIRTTPELVERLLNESGDYARRIADIVDELIANPGHSGEVGGRYIADAINERRKAKRI